MLKKNKQVANKSVEDPRVNPFVLSVFASTSALGIAIIAFTMPVATTLKSQLVQEESYKFALFREIDYNEQRAEAVVKQYQSSKVVSEAPAYSHTAYDSILNAGLLNLYDTDTASRLISLYSHISLWPDSFEAYPTIQGENNISRDHALAIHAKNTTAYIKSYSTDLSITNRTERLLAGYSVMAIVGTIITVISGVLLIALQIIGARIVSAASVNQGKRPGHRKAK